MDPMQANPLGIEASGLVLGADVVPQAAAAQARAIQQVAERLQASLATCAAQLEGEEPTLGEAGASALQDAHQDAAAMAALLAHVTGGLYVPPDVLNLMNSEHVQRGSSPHLLRDLCRQLLAFTATSARMPLGQQSNCGKDPAGRAAMCAVYRLQAHQHAFLAGRAGAEAFDSNQALLGASTLLGQTMHTLAFNIHHDLPLLPSLGDLPSGAGQLSRASAATAASALTSCRHIGRKSREGVPGGQLAAALMVSGGEGPQEEAKAYVESKRAAGSGWAQGSENLALGRLEALRVKAAKANDELERMNAAAAASSGGHWAPKAESGEGPLLGLLEGGHASDILGYAPQGAAASTAGAGDSEVSAFFGSMLYEEGARAAEAEAAVEAAAQAAAEAVASLGGSAHYDFLQAPESLRAPGRARASAEEQAAKAEARAEAKARAKEQAKAAKEAAKAAAKEAKAAAKEAAKELKRESREAAKELKDLDRGAGELKRGRASLAEDEETFGQEEEEEDKETPPVSKRARGGSSRGALRHPPTMAEIVAAAQQKQVALPLPPNRLPLRMAPPEAVEEEQEQEAPEEQAAASELDFGSLFSPPSAASPAKERKLGFLPSFAASPARPFGLSSLGALSPPTMAQPWDFGEAHFYANVSRSLAPSTFASPARF